MHSRCNLETHYITLFLGLAETCARTANVVFAAPRKHIIFPFFITRRNVCQNCKCPREMHDVYSDLTVLAKAAAQINEDDDGTPEKERKKSITFRKKGK